MQRTFAACSTLQAIYLFGLSSNMSSLVLLSPALAPLALHRIQSSCIHLALQWQAFNEATFRVPDEDGWRPDHEPIEASCECPLGTRLITRLPIQSLLGALPPCPCLFPLSHVAAVSHFCRAQPSSFYCQK